MYPVEDLIETTRKLAKGTRPSIVVAKAPGRVEVMGNHTDYNGGLVLAATIERYVWSVGVRSDDTVVCSREFDECMTLEDGPVPPSQELNWKTYIRGVHWSLDRRGHTLRGLAASVGGDVPLGAGLSSSAALEVSYTNLLNVLGGLRLNSIDLATVAYEAERHYCNVSCGIMDQFTSQLCKRNSVLGIDCSTRITWDSELDPGLRLVVVDSMIRRSAADVLNQRRHECTVALETLRQAGYEIENLSQLTPRQIPEIERLLDDTAFKRVRHVVEENERVRTATDLLMDYDFWGFGNLMFQSHESSRDLYEVSHENLDLLVEMSRSIEGVLGARMTGAGLGGSILALVKYDHVESFVSSIVSLYERETGLTPSVIHGAIPGGPEVRWL